MDRRYFALGALGLGLVACAPINSARLGPDGLPLPQVYRITEADRDAVMLRMLDAVNSLRKAAGRGPVALNAQLNAAAATHARDMAVQNRPWHFGSDGSSPLDRLRRVGYSGQLRGEAISESYETELETLAAWMQQPDTRDVILDRQANQMGFAWYQEPTGKLWWNLILADSRAPGAVPQANPVPIR
ncbi:MAG: Cysteine-rich secretory protein family [Rhodobacteraceae bacterium HLUCCA08]|nr:MAG: Cysteine-rich secretory protein family [Rhodobacteraceae bacterium HLUCCA08]